MLFANLLPHLRNPENIKLYMKYYGLILLLILVGCNTAIMGQSAVFAIIGDYGSGNADAAAVANLVKSWNTQFVITTGDNRYYSNNYDRTVGNNYCDFLAGAGSGTYCNGNGSSINAFFPSAGNHDHTDGRGIEDYLSYFDLPGAGIQSSGTSGSELFYDFVMGPVHFFVIDSYDALMNATMAVQQTWLQNQMAASSARWKIVYFHHPPYSSSSYHGSIEEMRWPFAQWGADVVASGHDHIYERLNYEGVTYFVNGLGGGFNNYGFSDPLPGSNMQYNGDFGAQRVVVDDTSMVFSLININGELIDELVLSRARVNTAPEFINDTIVEVAAYEDSAYQNSIAEYVYDPDGDNMHFSIVSGPSWLNLAADGDLSGTPANEDIGPNSWIIKVEDVELGADSATLQITVLGTDQDTVNTGNIFSEFETYENNGEPSIKVYPNPAAFKLMVKVDGREGNKGLCLYNLYGKMVYMESNITEFTEIDVTSFADGVYFLKIHGEGSFRIKKIMIY